MGLKDNYEEYKQRQEAKKYFRSQNDLYLSSNEWLKVVVIGVLLSVVCGIVLGVVSQSLAINFMYFYIILGIVIAKGVNKVSGVESNQMGILAAVLTLLACIVAEMPFVMIEELSLLSIPFLCLFSISNIINDLFLIVFIGLSVFIAYTNAK